MTRLAGKQVLMVIAPEQFRDEELAEPKAILESEGARVRVASTRTGACAGMLGARVTPDLTLADARAGDYDAVLVVGGSGSPRFLWNSTTLHDLLRDADAGGKVIGGICLSGAALARAGILAGKRATVWRTPESIAEMGKGKARVSAEHVVVDGRIVTADGPEAADQFGREIAHLLGD